MAMHYYDFFLSFLVICVLFLWCVVYVLGCCVCLVIVMSCTFETTFKKLAASLKTFISLYEIIIKYSLNIEYSMCYEVANCLISFTSGIMEM